jgi:hypothetical protein
MDARDSDPKTRRRPLIHAIAAEIDTLGTRSSLKPVMGHRGAA